MNNCEKNSLVSVIVPVYNVEKYLKRCLDSIVNQTYKNIEIICIDDGSPDRSIDILREFEKKDNRVKVIRQQNMGLSGARNTGIDKAQGEYIIFVDSDDYIETKMIELMVQKIEKQNHDLVVCGVIYRKSKTEYTAVNIKKIEELLSKSIRKIDGKQYFKIVTSKTSLFTAAAWNKMYRRKIIIEKEIRFPVGRLYEDLLFVFEYLFNCTSVGVVPEALYDYYISRPGSITNKINKNDIDDTLFTYGQIINYLENNNFSEIADSIEFKDYMFLWINRATIFKLESMTHLYKWKEIDKVFDNLKKNSQYRKLCFDILSKSKNWKNIICAKTLFISNRLFMLFLRINSMKNKIKRLKK